MCLCDVSLWLTPPLAIWGGNAGWQHCPALHSVGGLFWQGGIKCGPYWNELLLPYAPSERERGAFSQAAFFHA